MQTLKETFLRKKYFKNLQNIVILEKIATHIISATKYHSNIVSGKFHH